MRHSTFFPSTRKSVSTLATIVILPAVMLCFIAPSAGAADRNSKVPEKAGAVFSGSEVSKPSSAGDKASTVDAGTSSNSSTPLNSAARDVDMVLLPQPLNRFTL